MAEVTTKNILGPEAELKKRLEKLSRAYDMTTMKVFLVAESAGEDCVYATYRPDRKGRWETFLTRREACRLDLSRHEKTAASYQQFLVAVTKEEQARQFHAAMMVLLQSKGATDAFDYIRTHGLTGNPPTFCHQLSRLFERKLDAWFERFEAVAVKLVGHVTVSGLVRVVSGELDALCRRDTLLYVTVIKVTGQESPRPIDVAELCLAKVLAVQNGLASPQHIRLALLMCHLGQIRPVLRLWEFRPTPEVEVAIGNADMDALIDAARLSPRHEFWRENLSGVEGKDGGGKETYRE